MIDLCKVVSGLELSLDAEEAMASYSDDLVDAIIDGICMQTKIRGDHRIIEKDVLNSVQAVSFFPPRVVPRATLKIFSPKAISGDGERPNAVREAPNITQISLKPTQTAVRPRKQVIDEAQFLEDIRKMKPKDTREPQIFYSHKLTLEAKDLQPRLGAAAIAEATAAMERPARHFIGRPQPLITEDRGCVQPELTTYNRYRNYLGITGPMPNIKPNIGPLTKLPAYLQALQQRNEMLGLASVANTAKQAPAQSQSLNRPAQPRPLNRPAQTQSLNRPAQPLSINRPAQQPIRAGPTQHPYQYSQQTPLRPPQSFPMPMNAGQAFQQMPPQNAAHAVQRFHQQQRRERWVDELERSALMSPTPPLSERSLRLRGVGNRAVGSVETPPGTPAPTRELTPPDDNEWETVDGPVDHVDCAEYYMRVNSGVKGKKAGSEPVMPVEVSRAEGRGQEQGVVQPHSNQSRKIIRPKPPAHFSAKEAEMFEKCVKMLEMIALSGSQEEP
ncbi:unnamed protein product [Haemonchus placei]|uniref:Transcription initiation factor TFIID subunit 8 n=1 Tax=Haemonchus placei TaxID=6290 RepID=A0A0N4WQM0_HAEPC|nr:unnamed protein product [Haemonchus placei]